MSKKQQKRLRENKLMVGFKVKADRVEQEEYLAQAISRTEISSNYQSTIMETASGSNDVSKQSEKIWKLSSDISGYPTFESDQILVDALYNLSLEEVKLNIETDQTFRTGEKWEGVWTRDISYSILLGLGLLEPEVSKNSLRRKVKAGKIIQDTGTGGAYPISSDRVVWALAAYEIYEITGEQDWLEEIFPIIKQSLSDDLKNVYDPSTGLMKGESSFLDWREQSYPRWMQPADIHESLALGTNAGHYQSYIILAKIARELGENEIAIAYENASGKLKNSINKHLWIEDKGYYGQFLYGRIHKIPSSKAEALGEALCVLFDIADQDRQVQIIAQTPISPFGIPSIFPQIAQIPAYHNDGVWPFVQAFWSLAAAKVGNEVALSESLDSIYRAAALFLTNKENFVAHSGDCEGTQINSDRQLWSVAGNLGMVYKVFFGLGFSDNHLTFNPFIPKKYAGPKKLNGLKIRKAVFDLEIEGYGNKIKTIFLDGKLLDNPRIPLTLHGQHDIKISVFMDGKSEDKSNMQAIRFTPTTPKVILKDNLLTWDKQEDSDHYKVLRNGVEIIKIQDSQFQLKNESYASYQVIAVNRHGDESFASEPLNIIAKESMSILDLTFFAGPVLTTYEGYQGNGYIEISKEINTSFAFKIEIDEAGRYALDFVYSNGNGPVNTDNRCAMRALFCENEFIGTVVFPQRGLDSWNDWGRSNFLQIDLEKGEILFKLSLEPFSENMNGDVNQAFLSHVRFVKIN